MPVIQKNIDRRFFIATASAAAGLALATPGWCASGTLDVTTFGAVADGATDSSNSIRAALAAAAKKGGGTLYFPPGKYRVSQDGRNPWCIMNTTDNLTILGDGASLECRDGGLQLFRSYSFNNLTASGLTVRGPHRGGHDRAAALFQVSVGDGIRLTNLHSEGSDQDGIAIANASNVHIEKTTGKNDSKSSLYVVNCDNTVIVSPAVSGFGGHVAGGKIVGCGIQLSSNRNLTLHDPVVSDGTGVGILLNANSRGSSPMSTDIFNAKVSRVKNDSNPGVSCGIRCANMTDNRNTHTRLIDPYVEECGVYNYYLENHDGIVVENPVGIESERSNCVISSISGATITNGRFVDSGVQMAQGSYGVHLINDARNVSVTATVSATARALQGADNDFHDQSSNRATNRLTLIR